MEKIFLDLEMNPMEERIEVSLHHWIGHEIIEIGAIKLDEEDEAIDTFSAYVRPTESAQIFPKITELTGITTAMVEAADPFPLVYDRFLAWCGQDYDIYSWSESDLKQMRIEHAYKVKDLREQDRYLFDHWKDYQQIYGSLLGWERKLTLSMALGVSGKDFAGRAHGALTDAKNTAGLYLQTKGHTFGKLLDKLDEGKEECTMSLGNLLSGFTLDP